MCRHARPLTVRNLRSAKSDLRPIYAVVLAAAPGRRRRFPVSPQDGRCGSKGAQTEPRRGADAVANLWGKTHRPAEGWPGYQRVRRRVRVARLPA